MVTLVDIAQAAGVSKATVSRALKMQERTKVAMAEVLEVSNRTTGENAAWRNMESVSRRLVDSLYMKTKGSYFRRERSMVVRGSPAGAAWRPRGCPSGMASTNSSFAIIS